MTSIKCVTMSSSFTALVIAGCLNLWMGGWNNCSAVAPEQLAEMSLEELMDVNIYSAAKKTQKLTATPAASYVITEEDIRHSGATSVPELLRLVPGMEVLQVNAENWAVSIRGFDGIFANKLLVLVDGRSVYQPSFAGVIWNQVNVPVQLIERIEVIRGPGGTLWGANAVNGVINILTKKAAAGDGAIVSLGGGSETRAQTFVSQTAPVCGGALRLYGAYENRGAAHDVAANKDAYDEGDLGSAGFRSDLTLSPEDTLVVQGDFRRNVVESETMIPALVPPFSARTRQIENYSGVNTILRWEHKSGQDSDGQIQLFYNRDQANLSLSEFSINTYDLDSQYRFTPFTANELTIGAGYRVISDDFQGGSLATFTPASDTVNLYSGFIQDDITLAPDRLHLILGSKLEHNDFTGWEVQPSARMIWTPAAGQSVWTAYSRAVRTPTRYDRGVSVDVSGGLIPPVMLPAVIRITGAADVVSETLNAYEAGYRVAPLENVVIDLAAFYFDYDHIRTWTSGAPELQMTASGPALLIEADGSNNASGHSDGFEGVVSWQPLKAWTLKGVYTYLDLEVGAHSPQDALNSGMSGTDPQNQFSLQSQLNLPYNLEFDAAWRYVSGLPVTSENPFKPASIGAYHELNLRLGWRPQENLEFSVIGQNLLHPKHSEYSDAGPIAPLSEIQRSVFGKVTYNFK